MKKHPLYLIILALVVMVGCQKEVSYEAGKNASHGSLQDDGTGDCLPKNVNGAYVAGTALAPATNTITVQVNVVNTGSYVIASDTVNGYYFRASGTFGTAGLNTVTLKGNGIPLAEGTNNFVIIYDTTFCFIAVTVLPAGAGGPATFTLNCTNPQVAGTYAINTALTTTNTIKFNVNISTIGTYNITTTAVNGMTFAASGAFTSTGANTLTLTGTGTPLTAGTFNILVTVGSTTCTVPITVTAVAVTDYFPRTNGSNWSYEYNDDANDSLYRTVISPTKSVSGNPYNIFMGNYGAGLDSSGYFRKASTDYFEYFDAGNFIGYDNPLWVEYIFVKDAAAGTNWKSSAFAGSYSGTPLTIRFSYTILQKDVPITFTTSKGSMSFTNVIVVEEKYEQLTGTSTWTDVTSVVGYGKSYYARNIGLIKYEFFAPNPVDSYQQELRRYNVF